jgi:hypothetical protein
MAATAIAAVIMASAPPAAAQAPTSPRAYSVPAGELEQALQDFVSQSGQRVLYSSQLVSGLSSPGVSGNLPRPARRARKRNCSRTHWGFS